MVDFFENLKMEQYGFKILIMVDFLGNSKDDTHHKKKNHRLHLQKKPLPFQPNDFLATSTWQAALFPISVDHPGTYKSRISPAPRKKTTTGTMVVFSPGNGWCPKKRSPSVQQNLMASTTFIMNLWRGVQRASMENYRGFCKCINKSCHKSHISGSADLLWSLVLISCLLWIHRSASWSFIKSAESASYRMASDHKPFFTQQPPITWKRLDKKHQKKPMILMWLVVWLNPSEKYCYSSNWTLSSRLVKSFWTFKKFSWKKQTPPPQKKTRILSFSVFWIASGNSFG